MPLFHNKSKERDEVKRQEFREEIGKYKVEERVYIDEAGMDNRDDYGYGWNEKGERFHALKSGKRSGRVNMIAGYCNGEILAPFTVEGACNRSIFEIWLETCLIPKLKPGQVVIGDNATFHKGGRIRELAERWGDVQFIVQGALIAIDKRYLSFLSCTEIETGLGASQLRNK